MINKAPEKSNYFSKFLTPAPSSSRFQAPKTNAKFAKIPKFEQARNVAMASVAALSIAAAPQ